MEPLRIFLGRRRCPSGLAGGTGHTSVRLCHLARHAWKKVVSGVQLRLCWSWVMTEEGRCTCAGEAQDSISRGKGETTARRHLIAAHQVDSNLPLDKEAVTGRVQTRYCVIHMARFRVVSLRYVIVP